MELSGKIFKFMPSVQIKNVNTGALYSVIFSENDGFFTKLKPYIIKEKVEGETLFNVDRMTVPNELYNSMEKQKFNLILNCMSGINENGETEFDTVYQIEIPNVVICSDSTSVAKRNNTENMDMDMQMYKVKVHYCTKIKVIELK